MFYDTNQIDNVLLFKATSAYIRDIKSFGNCAIRIKCYDMSNSDNHSSFKSSIENIQTIVKKHPLYKKSDKKALIEENINSLVCSYGTTYDEAKKNLEEHIRFNATRYNQDMKNKDNLDKMSQIFFDTIMDIDEQLFRV